MSVRGSASTKSPGVPASGLEPFTGISPTRDAILEAVYRRAVQQLAEAAGRLIETEAPIEALRAWMGLFIDYIATKKIIAPALNALTDPSALFATSGMQIKSAIATLVERAAAQGDIQPDVNPIDLLYALVGFANANSAPDWEPRARRLVNILIAGLKPPARVGLALAVAPAEQYPCPADQHQQRRRRTPSDTGRRSGAPSRPVRPIADAWPRRNPARGNRGRNGSPRRHGPLAGG
jgi:hypothetical protein